MDLSGIKHGEVITSAENRSVLGELIYEARTRKGKSQRDIADAIGLKAPQVSYFENGSRQPSISQVAALAHILDLEMEALILARAADEFASDGATEWPEGMREQQPRVVAKLKQQIYKIKCVSMSAKTTKVGGRTFLDFPDREAFGEIVVVTGDKREDPPKTLGDIGAYSASPIDDRWIWLLPLGSTTEKVSDKEFVISDEARLKKEYGKRTLFIIGSPASNQLGRIVNRCSFFRFNFLNEFEQDLQAMQKKFFNQSDELAINRLKEENLPLLKRIMRRFFAYGIVDPMVGDVSGFASRPERDYATISFAENPYSEPGDYSHPAIMVAGFHHPGTVHALKFLGMSRNTDPTDPKNPTTFAHHPYGGVLEVRMQEYRWEDRMKKGVIVNWETPAYDKESLRASLQKMIGRKSSLLGGADTDIERCIKLLDGL